MCISILPFDAEISIQLYFFMLEIGEMVISAFIGLVGLGPASRVFTFHLLFRR